MATSDSLRPPFASAQDSDDVVRGQVSAVLYLTGFKVSSPVSVSQLVIGMKLNMKVRAAAAHGPRACEGASGACSVESSEAATKSAVEGAGVQGAGNGARKSALTSLAVGAQDFFLHVEEAHSRLRPGEPCAELSQLKEQHARRSDRAAAQCLSVGRRPQRRGDGPRGVGPLRRAIAATWLPALTA